MTKGKKSMSIMMKIKMISMMTIIMPTFKITMIIMLMIIIT